MESIKKYVEEVIEYNYNHYITTYKTYCKEALDCIYAMNECHIAANARNLSALDNYELIKYNDALYDEAIETQTRECEG